MPWARGLKKLDRGLFDGIYPTYDSILRRNKYLYSDVLMDGPLVFLKNTDHKIPFKNLKDLTGKKIGVVRGYIYNSEFDTAKFLTKIEASNDEQNIRKLISGKLDLIVIDKINLNYLLKTKFHENIKEFNFLIPPLENKGLHILFNKKSNNEKVKRDFNDGLKLIKTDGIVDEILGKYVK